MRNLTKEETKAVIAAFGEKLKTIDINGKPLVTGFDEHVIAVNPKITIDEIQHTFGVPDKNILSFIRQLYLRLISKIIQETIGGDIIHAPTVSFIENNNIIQINY